jgi:hypothetical protein
MCLVGDITSNGTLSNEYQQTTDFCHYVKWDEKICQKRAHSGLSPDRRPLHLATYLQIVSVECVEEFEIPLEVFTNVRLEDGFIQSLFPSLASCVLISTAVIGNGHALFVVHRNSSK